MTAPARNLLVATRPGDGLGFRLAGVPVAEVASGEEAARLRAWCADTAIGVVAVEQRLLDALLGRPNAIEELLRVQIP